DQGFDRLKGADKKQLADSVYKLLPERVGDHDVTFVKTFVTQERFEALVQNAFDQFDQFYLTHHTHFDEEFHQWAAQNKPVIPSSATSIPPALPA
ncbi:MAG: hypothetical protein LC737_03790, partial [Chloroflexi bacterium]|nr:hypothetical protein [Chloroflexota bacterium]